MLGVSEGRTGGMWTVANNFINNDVLNNNISLKYIPLSTGGNFIKRIIFTFFHFFVYFFELLRFKPDIVYVHMAEKGSVFRKGIAIAFAKIFGCKTVIQMHSGPIFDWYNTCGKLKKKISRKIFNSADLFLVLGNYWKEEVSKIVKEDKIQVLYNGIDIPNENFYSSKNNNIVFIGRMNKLKGVFDLVDAIEMIKNKIPENIKFVFCGEDETNVLTKYIDEKGLSNYIIMRGWINSNQVKIELKNALLNVLPSYTEALSMNILEAMSYGVPSVTTRITTMPEMIDDEYLVNVGDKCQLADKLLECINNRKKLEKESKVLYERAKKTFDIDTISQNLVEYCKKICGDDYEA